MDSDEMNANRQAKLLTLINKGTPDHPRVMIADQYFWVWNGTEFVEDHSKGLLYMDPDEGAKALTDMLMQEYKRKPKIRFQAPIYVDIFSDEKPLIYDVQNWAHKSAQLMMDTRAQGVGPFDGAFGYVSIDWRQMFELGRE